MPIEVKDLEYTYSQGTPFEKKALAGIDLTVNEGDFVGILGHTGSGKSTFILHLNGLIKLQSGSIDVFGIKLVPDKKNKQDLRRLRGTVGMVFQYPEYQLFEDTVEKDVAFGPKNLGLSEEEVAGRVERAIRLVGLDYEDVRSRAPFELSGGQRRRVAIAGIIAMQPRVLVLDEPTAGLDPYGKEQILSLITKLKKECSPTVIVISHDVDEITRFASRIVVFNDGKVAFDVPMNELFRHGEELQAMGLEIPKAVRIADELRRRGIDLGDVVNADDLVRAVVRKFDKTGMDETDIAKLSAAQFDFDGLYGASASDVRSGNGGGSGEATA